MKPDNINYEFLAGVLSGEHADVYYHFGTASDDPMLEPLREVKAVILAGSPSRVLEFADRWAALNAGAPVTVFPKTDRFTTAYCAGVLFASHGMGMPSASIALQELMRMVFFLKAGDLEEMDKVFFARVGTSGGVGLPGGTVVLTSQGLMADLRPYRIIDGLDGEVFFNPDFPLPIAEAIACAAQPLGVPVVIGKTIAGNEFFLEQLRLDGAIRLADEARKMDWLTRLREAGVANIEMEGAMLAGYLNHWGFSRFAMICCTLLDRLDGDQVTASAQQLHGYSQASGDVLFAYLETIAR